MPIFQVDASKCRRDGICGKVCPMQILSSDEAGLPFLIGGSEGNCIGCGQCVAFCPHGASSLDGLPMETVRKVDRKLFPTPEALTELLQTRRSVRVFSDKKVPRETLEEIVKMSSYAPTAKNQRRVRWAIVDDAGKMRLLVEKVADWLEQFAGTEPKNPIQRTCKVMVTKARRGQDPVFRGAGQLAVAVAQRDPWGKSDAAIALSYFELAAHSLGVGCCWAGYFTSAAEHSPEIRLIMGLRPGEIIGGAQSLGYPGIRPTYTPPRADVPIEWID